MRTGSLPDTQTDGQTDRRTDRYKEKQTVDRPHIFTALFQTTYQSQRQVNGFDVTS